MNQRPNPMMGSGLGMTRIGGVPVPMNMVPGVAQANVGAMMQIQQQQRAQAAMRAGMMRPGVVPGMMRPGVLPGMMPVFARNPA